MLFESRWQPQEELVAPLTSGVKVGQTHTGCIKERQIAEREIAGRKRLMRSRSANLHLFRALHRCVRACVCKKGADLSSSEGSRPCSPAVTAECTGR